MKPLPPSVQRWHHRDGDELREYSLVKRQQRVFQSGPVHSKLMQSIKRITSLAASLRDRC